MEGCQQTLTWILIIAILVVVFPFWLLGSLLCGLGPLIDVPPATMEPTALPQRQAAAHHPADTGLVEDSGG